MLLNSHSMVHQLHRQGLEDSPPVLIYLRVPDIVPAVRLFPLSDLCSLSFILCARIRDLLLIPRWIFAVGVCVLPASSCLDSLNEANLPDVFLHSLGSQYTDKIKSKLSQFPNWTLKTSVGTCWWHSFPFKNAGRHLPLRCQLPPRLQVSLMLRNFSLWPKVFFFFTFLKIKYPLLAPTATPLLAGQLCFLKNHANANRLNRHAVPVLQKLAVN